MSHLLLIIFASLVLGFLFGWEYAHSTGTCSNRQSNGRISMIEWIKRYLSGMHEWKYRNPYDRRCTICNRHEVKHGWNFTDLGWWEIFDEGDAILHKATGESNE